MKCTSFMLLMVFAIMAPLFATGNVLLELGSQDSGTYTDARYARTMGLRVASGEPVSPFLIEGPFRARWTADLNLETRSRLYFSMEGTGKAVLKVGGETLLTSFGKTSERLRLNAGKHEIVLEYQSPASGDAVVQVFWEERQFVREPVPPEAFARRGENHQLAESQGLLRRGQVLFSRHQCARCHLPEVENEWHPLAPSLEGIGSRLSGSWMAEWIANPQGVRSTAHMPQVFRHDSEKKAGAVAAYLETLTGPVNRDLVGESKRGGHLFHEQGCIACHQLKSADSTDDRIPLVHAGAKFKGGALAAFLKKPNRFHASTRMPEFGFSDQEAADLAVFLRMLGPAGSPSETGGAALGKTLLESSGCLNCHSLPGHKTTMKVPSLAGLGVADWRSRGCLSEAESAAPKVSVSKDDLEALIAFGTSPYFLTSVNRLVVHEYAEQQWEALRCFACHMRDGEEALVRGFEKETIHLEMKNMAAAHAKGPPHLTHVAQKLQTPWLSKLLSGDIQPKVRPWLPARMPAFPFYAEHLATGIAHAEGFGTTAEKISPPNPVETAHGEKLVGPKGIVCGACHAVGNQSAVGVFEGQGPNLRESGERLREDYYLRWMHDPQRFIPGTAMPKYATDGLTPFSNIHQGDAGKQFEAIFHYLRSLKE